MNRYKLMKAGILVNEGIARFGQDREIYEEYLYKFPQDEQYLNLCDAMGKKDVKTAFSAAHSLKGEAGNLSLKTLYEDICPLVELLRAGTLDGTNEYMDKVTKDYERILETLEDEKQGK